MADILHVGVTGTRYLLPAAQEDALARALLEAVSGHDGELVLHQGCCTGADEAACQFIGNFSAWSIHGHPGHGPDGKSPWRSYGAMGCCTVLHSPRRYYLRNRDIADACSVLVAVPAYPEADPRSARSGTWQCVRDARARSRDILYAWPDGTREKP